MIEIALSYFINFIIVYNITQSFRLIRLSIHKSPPNTHIAALIQNLTVVGYNFFKCTYKLERYIMKVSQELNYYYII